jgi:hypothetical protein
VDGAIALMARRFTAETQRTQRKAKTGRASVDIVASWGVALLRRICDKQRPYHRGLNILVLRKQRVKYLDGLGKRMSRGMD